MSSSSIAMRLPLLALSAITAHLLNAETYLSRHVMVFAGEAQWSAVACCKHVQDWLLDYLHHTAPQHLPAI